ncbi:MAG TPA: dihydroneopterin aldolase [Paracoccaceae bacterium]|nr:dihydroneopterin aldolase [Paracoccaceae bacterium]
MPPPTEPTDAALAFAHPSERAAATAPPDPRDRILLSDHVAWAEIGAFQQERDHRQRLRFDVVVEVAPPEAPLADDVDRILSYDRITEAIEAELAAERLNLLETLAERLAERILASPQAMRVFVRIGKLDLGPHVKGVEIVRARGVAPVMEDGLAVHPSVALLTNAMIAAPDLPVRLDAVLARGGATILCVGLPDLARPATGHRPTQRRIDLLAIEQNAWALAARDARCVVVASRTEIDWAVRRGRSVVWAPSKMVLDAVDGPRGTDPGALALWLAETMAARVLILPAGMAPSAGSRVAVETWGG